jgi:hypothetical protein
MHPLDACCDACCLLLLLLLLLLLPPPPPRCVAPEPAWTNMAVAADAAANDGRQSASGAPTVAPSWV